MCHGLSVWTYNRFLPISPHFGTRLYGQVPPRRGEVWHSKTPSGTYTLTKPFRPTNRLKMRPTATKISVASFTASPITWPMPLMMAQSNSVYNITISITKSFLSLKVSHFLWDSQGSSHHSASTEELSSSGHHQHRPCLPSHTDILFPQCWNSDIKKSSNTANKKFRLSEFCIVSNYMFQSFIKSETHIFIKSDK